MKVAVFRRMFGNKKCIPNPSKCHNTSLIHYLLHYFQHGFNMNMLISVLVYSPGEVTWSNAFRSQFRTQDKQLYSQHRMFLCFACPDLSIYKIAQKCWNDEPLSHFNWKSCPGEMYSRKWLLMVKKMLWLIWFCVNVTVFWWNIYRLLLWNMNPPVCSIFTKSSDTALLCV